MRQHEEFVWLHDRYVENDEYAGIIVSIFFSFKKIKILTKSARLDCSGVDFMIPDQQILLFSSIFNLLSNLN